MSENKAPEVVSTILTELEGHGPYADPALAREVRLADSSS